jgi:IclR family acetate operon transcriptional repressor
VSEIPEGIADQLADGGRLLAVVAGPTGVGKAVLAQLPDADVREILRRVGMPAQTERSITDPDILLADLQLVRARGWAEDDGEQEIGVHCFAVPLPGAPTPTAISVSGPEARVTRDAADRIVPVLLRTAQDIGADLREEAHTA